MYVRLEWIDEVEAIITVEKTRKSFLFFGKEMTQRIRYRGSCTVWHELPDCERPGTSMEFWLCSIWNKHMYDKKDRELLGAKI